MNRLCKLELQTGETDEHGQALKEIYESFTEGFGTADLIEAKRVMNQWQG